MDGRTLLADRFEEHRAQLKAVAYRLLGSPSEAEDAVHPPVALRRRLRIGLQGISWRAAQVVERLRDPQGSEEGESAVEHGERDDLTTAEVAPPGPGLGRIGAAIVRTRSTPGRSCRSRRHERKPVTSAWLWASRPALSRVESGVSTRRVRAGSHGRPRAPAVRPTHRRGRRAPRGCGHRPPRRASGSRLACG